MKVAEFADALCRKTALLSASGNASVSAIPSESVSRNVSLDICVFKAALSLSLMKKVEATSSKAGVSKVSMPKLLSTSKPSATAVTSTWKSVVPSTSVTKLVFFCAPYTATADTEKGLNSPLQSPGMLSLNVDISEALTSSYGIVQIAEKPPSKSLLGTFLAL